MIMFMSRSKGFSLIELMVVVAIIAILAGIAVPSYVSHTTKARRVAAIACIGEISQFMERYRTVKMSYAGAVMPGVSCVDETSSSYSYVLDVAVNGGNFSITASPQGSQASNDHSCGALSIDSTGVKKSSVSGKGCF